MDNFNAEDVPGNAAFEKAHDALDRLAELLDDPDDGDEPGEAEQALARIKTAGQDLFDRISDLSLVDFNEEYAEVAEEDAPEEDAEAGTSDPFAFLS